MANITQGSSTLNPQEYERYRYTDLAQLNLRNPETDAWKNILTDAMDTLVSSMCTYEKGPDWSLEDEWDDPMVLELEHLLSLELTLRIRGAIKNIVASGYTEEVAQWAILSCGTCFGMNDVETNIYEGVKNLLETAEKFNVEKDKPPIFEDLESVVSFSVLENVSVLKEVMPGISIAEAIWYLLLYGSNLMLLCAAKVILVNIYPYVRYSDTYFDRKFIEETDENSMANRTISRRDILKMKTKVLREDNKSRMHMCSWKTKVKSFEEDMARLKILEDQNAKMSKEESSLDERDKILVLLREKVKELEKEKEDWTKWANEKVKQAAKRLGSDQTELKQLRADKKEAEKCTTGEKVNNNKTLTRMIQVASNLSCTQANAERINTLTTQIEEENSKLKKSVHDKIIEVESVCEEVKKSNPKEQILLKRLQEEEKMNNLLAEELMKLKACREVIESNLNKDNARLKQEEGREAQRSKEIEQIMKSVQTIRSEREQMIDEANKQQESALKKSEKYKEEIEKLEAQMFVKTPKRLPVFEDIYEEIHEHECVMCLDEEKSVVFLPCRHQVVCVQYNEQHEKQGMKECPTCRTTITRRIHAVFIHQNVKSLASHIERSLGQGV